MPGASQLSLDVFSGITAEYLSNVGRTFRFYLDKYSNTMTSEVCQYLGFSRPRKGRTYMVSVGNYPAFPLRERRLPNTRSGEIYHRRRRATWEPLE
jgi:hypothetical protein